MVLTTKNRRAYQETLRLQNHSFKAIPKSFKVQTILTIKTTSQTDRSNRYCHQHYASARLPLRYANGFY